MAVTVHVASVIQRAVDGARQVEASGATVGDLIADVERRFPGFREQVLDESGGMRRFVNVYLNDEDVRYLQGAETPVADGDTVSFLPALAGGAR